MCQSNPAWPGAAGGQRFSARRFRQLDSTPESVHRQRCSCKQRVPAHQYCSLDAARTRGARAPLFALYSERIASLKDPRMLAPQIRSSCGWGRSCIVTEKLPAILPEDVATALAQFDPVWDALVPREQANLLQLLIKALGL